MSSMNVMKDVLSANFGVASELRQRFAASGTLVLNVIASPGAGKTTLLERTVEELREELRIGVIEGDIATSIDADRVAMHGVPAQQINTEGGCHLEARQIAQVIDELPAELDLLIVENVGNLVCPNDFDLGEDFKIIVASLPEGEDKPLKYPGAFTAAGACVISKIDLAPYIPASVDDLRANALNLNPDLPIFALSSITGEGLDAWFGWIREQVTAKKASAGA